MDPKLNETGKKTEEHGPFAGAGFFRDLVVISQARSAFIGTSRSSSALVDELMEYDRHNNAWVIEDKLLNQLPRCYIEHPTRSAPPQRN
jgi:hypothetical protein